MSTAARLIGGTSWTGHVSDYSARRTPLAPLSATHYVMDCCPSLAASVGTYLSLPARPLLSHLDCQMSQLLRSVERREAPCPFCPYFHQAEQCISCFQTLYTCNVEQTSIDAAIVPRVHFDTFYSIALILLFKPFWSGEHFWVITLKRCYINLRNGYIMECLLTHRWQDCIHRLHLLLSNTEFK